MLSREGYMRWWKRREGSERLRCRGMDNKSAKKEECVMFDYVISPLFSINALIALVTAFAPSRTAALSSSLTRGMTRPSNLSGWKRSIVPLSSSLRVLPFPASSCPSPGKKRNAEIASAVISEISGRPPRTGHGISPNPRSADCGFNFDSSSPAQRWW